VVDRLIFGHVEVHGIPLLNDVMVRVPPTDTVRADVKGAYGINL